MSFDLTNSIEFLAKAQYRKQVQELDVHELHNCLSRSVMADIADSWEKSSYRHKQGRCAYYFSAEFLVGRLIFNNLLCLGKIEEAREALEKFGFDLSCMEEIEDAALGNGGLGRLAACFLDSAATLSIPLDGYGIRYKYGIFRQSIENCEQTEYADDWTHFGDPWSVRREEDTQIVEFADFRVKAVPYDMPVIGYMTENKGTLRLWQCEPVEEFNFTAFNNQKYDVSVEDKNRAENISRVLYPNDSTDDGRKLRLSQQYFFCSASLKDIIKSYKKFHGDDFSQFSDYVTIQLNDTHPVISVPELIRLLTTQEKMSFENALAAAMKTFNYTNHTVMLEALEKWDLELMESLLPEVTAIIVKINAAMQAEFKSSVDKKILDKIKIISDGKVNMAYLAIYCSSYVNGVAQIHTDILKNDVLKEWYSIYPQRFRNKTNGITQRRWLALCNAQLSSLITELLGNDEWITDLTQLKNLEKYQDDDEIISRFTLIKAQKKRELCEYILKQEKTSIDENSIFDIQIKRLHEYKRQFLNILAIIELYFEIKEGSLTDFAPTTFIFGAKSAPGYERAKGIIKLINTVAAVIENDPEVNKIIKVIFISNYNVSYAEKLVAAADVSEQISTAGTEASGTGNMKFMLNGAVTLGTLDGANVEIVREAGEENNYIFGAKVGDIESIRDKYDPTQLYENDKKIKRVLDSLIDGTFSDDSGIFKELRNSILKGASWHKPDQYFLLLDFESYLEEKIRVNREYKDTKSFMKKCWINMCNAGFFSSDRTIAEYAKDIWKIDKI
ncbi:MAG: glycogen/starch/alpha-glucan phosphorylase [Oscillospiraceae bacterium]|nr:glycogen/starch/alpha-glucan phosphorylase [Oscillospiraceae bacterium]